MRARYTRSVYVIGPENGPFKIGISRNIPERLSIIQAVHPEPVRLHLHVASHNTRLVRREAHERLKAFEVGREWFACSLQHAMAAVYQGAAMAEMTDRTPRAAA